jgi:hypothetical protein
MHICKFNLNLNVSNNKKKWFKINSNSYKLYISLTILCSDCSETLAKTIIYEYGKPVHYPKHNLSAISFNPAWASNDPKKKKSEN